MDWPTLAAHCRHHYDKTSLTEDDTMCFKVGGIWKSHECTPDRCPLQKRTTEDVKSNNATGALSRGGSHRFWARITMISDCGIETLSTGPHRTRHVAKQRGIRMAQSIGWRVVKWEDGT